MLANHHPQLRFLIQDRESVVGDAIEVTQTQSDMTCADKCTGHSTGRRTCQMRSNLAALKSEVNRFYVVPGSVQG